MRKLACSLLVVSLLALAPAAAPAEPDPHLAGPDGALETQYHEDPTAVVRFED